MSAKTTLRRSVVMVVLFGLLFNLIVPASSQAVSGDEPLPAGSDQLIADSTPSVLAGAEYARSIREGDYPAQLAGSTGSIQPDRYGPQHNDPADGVPAHAYSPFDERSNREYPCPPGGCDFMAGQVLIKLAPEVTSNRAAVQGQWTGEPSLNQALAAQGVQRLEPIFPQAQPPKRGESVTNLDGQVVPKPDLTRWYRASLTAESDVTATVESLSKAPGVAWVEPDFLRKPVGTFESFGFGGRSGIGMPDLRILRRSDGIPMPSPRETRKTTLNLPGPGTDPLYAQQWHLDAANVPAAWAYLESQGLPPGGNRDIVVAVIDTGVDYTHPDLAANIWVNPAEFNGLPGVDDDHNGYVDDIHGADTVTPDGNPQDDHGHGTHVAGIIAAQANNGIGGVGVAYNVQIMPIKAAQYSGVLASSDIAKAIYYAVEKGADVINMSFGGYARSQVEEDALAVAFGQAVLVAAAGNDSKVNLPCGGGRDMYPAAYNWVLGVMASTSSGGRAGFSNYDCVPHDTHEYELMAPGVDVWSTLPNGQYAAWDGTSMSAPVVAGIAALLRTYYTDRDLYSSRFIMGQIAANAAGGTGGVANAYAALTVAPRPELRYLEHWLFDTTTQSASNDDDGIVDAGETVDLAIVIRNHWGKADPVTVTLEPWADGAVFPDPYVTMITDTVSYGAIGSFNQDDNGLIYAGDVITGVRNPFRFTVPITTPNDHVIPFRLTMTAGNGYDPDDPNAPYTFESRFNLIVQRGTELPTIISVDMTLTKDYYWLVPDATLIKPGVTLTVTEGTQIEFWSTDPSNPYHEDNRPYVQVEGHLIIAGTQEEPVELFNSPLYPGYAVDLRAVEGTGSSLDIQYARVMNPILKGSTLFDYQVDHSYFAQELLSCVYQYYETQSWIQCRNAEVRAKSVSNTIFHKLGGKNGGYFTADNITQISKSIFDSSYIDYQATSAQENVFLVNYRLVPQTTNYQYLTSQSRHAGYICSGCSNEQGVSNNQFIRNAILNTWCDPDASHWMRFYAPSWLNRDYDNYITIPSPIFGKALRNPISGG